MQQRPAVKPSPRAGLSPERCHTSRCSGTPEQLLLPDQLGHGFRHHVFPARPAAADTLQHRVGMNQQEFSIMVQVPRAVDEIDPQHTEDLLILQVLVALEHHVQVDLRDRGMRSGLKTNAWPAMPRSVV